MLNHIVIMGRLTRDPELRRTQTGVSVASFTLAVDRDYSSQGGEKQTDFIGIVAWRGTGDFVAGHFTKGRMAVVSGRLQIREYTGQRWKEAQGGGGRRRQRLFWRSRKDAESQDKPVGYTSPVTGSDFAELSEDDGDLPF